MLKSTDEISPLMKSGETSMSIDDSQIDITNKASSEKEESQLSGGDMPIWEKKLAKLEKK